MPRYRPAQCLEYALKKWYREGGHIVMRKSEHWIIPHVMHLSKAGVLTHYVPPDKLPRPWHSVFGFEGIVKTGDTAPAPPMPMLGMLLGSIILLTLGGLWALKWRITEGLAAARWGARVIKPHHVILFALAVSIGAGIWVFT